MSKEDKLKDELDDETKKKSQDGEILDEDEDLEEGEEEGGEEGKKERTFSQRQVNKMLAREKKNIKSSILKELGLDKVDNDKVENFVSFLSGSSKKQENKEEKRVKEMEKKIRELEEKNTEVELKSSILENGISKKYSSVATLLIKQKFAEDEDLTMEDIVKDLKNEYPEWFEEAQEDNNNNRTYGTGRQVAKSNVKKSSGNSTNSISARLIEARKNEQSSQKTYEGWKNDF